eukprot:CAMPEP_0196827642 /NCGR_PEP_ID=MMETSP1362-20130617/94265_1 /TAXON_ID=163516 /ORGANISM="Leptocylindrus danicus, Strain CCMP1856" /LENGTH=172 /DNA_ID=CAMNT_0042208287 /DNA_START=548 /DNA_END=1066 /DNA_ORIENTATION=+
MDNTNATKQDDALQFFYIVPAQPYEYEHPEQTGKDIPPFFSIWFCGLPANLDVDYISWDNIDIARRPRLAKSVRELEEWQAVPTQKRLNPKQRKKLKMKKMANASETLQSSLSDIVLPRKNGGTRGDPIDSGEPINDTQAVVSSGQGDHQKRSKKKKSIHRDANGVRKKRRF